MRVRLRLWHECLWQEREAGVGRAWQVWEVRGRSEEWGACGMRARCGSVWQEWMWMSGEDDGSAHRRPSPWLGFGGAGVQRLLHSVVRLGRTGVTRVLQCAHASPSPSGYPDALPPMQKPRRHRHTEQKRRRYASQQYMCKCASNKNPRCSVPVPWGTLNIIGVCCRHCNSSSSQAVCSDQHENLRHAHAASCGYAATGQSMQGPAYAFGHLCVRLADPGRSRQIQADSFGTSPDKTSVAV